MKAALFDLDGVIVDTEPQYTRFWTEVRDIFLPGNDHFPLQIKGQTLTYILSSFFPDEGVRQQICGLLRKFEENMTYQYISGALAWVSRLSESGVPTAIVTSSDKEKMSHLYKAHPSFERLFTAIHTAEYDARSKPAPDCYLSAADTLGVRPDECVVFEDSFNGVKAGKASGAFVVGLATSNSKEDLLPYCDIVVEDFAAENLIEIEELFPQLKK